MELSTAIRERRAVRSYDPRPVPDDAIRSLLDAAVHAPSAMNAQPWSFAIVQDRERLTRWSQRAKEMLLASEAGPKARRYEALLRDESFCIFYDAGTLIVIGVDEPGPYAEADAWLAAQNLMLAATQAGLGTCCIGFAVPVLDTPDVKRELGLAERGIAIAPIVVGYPRAPSPAIERRAPRIASWLRGPTP